MSDDYRKRLAQAVMGVAIRLKPDPILTEMLRVFAPFHLKDAEATPLVDAFLVVRDEEMTELRAQVPTCNGLCLKASDVLDDMSNVVGNPIAREHRSCPLHGDLEAAAWELDAALDKATSAVDRVRALHFERDGRCANCWQKCDCYPVGDEATLQDNEEMALRWSECPHANVEWPCPTIRALDGA